MAALILLRSHLVNDHVQKAYETLRRRSETSETLVLLDISNGDAQSDLPTLRFCGDRLARMGLELYPEKRWAWFAGDYALYCAFLDRPEFSHYVMIDYDARVNFSIDDFVARIESGGHDFVAPYAGFENADWMWTAAGKFWFERVAGSLFPIIAVSRRLIVKCLEHRLSQSRLVPAEKDERRRFLEERWMNCEAFVPSVALREGYSMVDIQKLVPGWDYSFMRDVDVLHWDMPQLADVPCAHPVFLKQDLPEQIRRKLRDLPQGDLRSWLIARTRELLQSDRALWSAVQEANAELRD
jgi:hypothetical protein